MITAADVNTMGELCEWLAARGLKMKPRRGRGSSAMFVVELRKAGQPHVARPIVVGSGTDWESATRNAMFEYEIKEGVGASVG